MRFKKYFLKFLEVSDFPVGTFAVPSDAYSQRKMQSPLRRWILSLESHRFRNFHEISDANYGFTAEDALWYPMDGQNVN